jgi:hypothetical protein
MADEDLNQLDAAMQFEVLAAKLKADHGASGDLLEYLAKMLESSYAGGTKVSRSGLFGKRPVSELTVRFDDWEFIIVREKHGTVNARAKKLVKGVGLKTNDISMEQCIDDVLKELVKTADKNAQTRNALDKFVSG